MAPGGNVSNGLKSGHYFGPGRYLGPGRYFGSWQEETIFLGYACSNTCMSHGIPYCIQSTQVRGGPAWALTRVWVTKRVKGVDVLYLGVYTESGRYLG